MAQAARTRAFLGEDRLPAERRTEEVPALIAQNLVIDIGQGRPVRIERWLQSTHRETGPSRSVGMKLRGSFGK